MAIGQCKLCLKSKELQNSHYLPSEVYRVLREGSLENPNPVLNSRSSIVQVSDQLKAHLLCADCEGLFDRNGEKWVLSKMARREGFPLWEILKSKSPVKVEETTSTFAGSSIPELNMDKLVYFGLSVFWRGAAHQWRSRRGAIDRIMLGPYEERLRKFLLGRAAYPDMVSIVISISPT